MDIGKICKKIYCLIRFPFTSEQDIKKIVTTCRDCGKDLGGNYSHNLFFGPPGGIQAAGRTRCPACWALNFKRLFFIFIFAGAIILCLYFAYAYFLP
jgi:hypothetical protein